MEYVFKYYYKTNTGAKYIQMQTNVQ